MSNLSRGFCVGIDSGGTKCELLIGVSGIDKSEILYKNSYKGIHYSVAGPELYSTAVTEFINDAFKKAKVSFEKCRGICVGIAGAREEKDRENLKKLFQKKLKFKNILITTDAMTALYGAFGGEEGIILISGTGSVLYGFTDDKITRVGGWGRIIGDEGSGYWLGKKALNVIVSEYDNIHRPESLLSKNIFKEFGINKKNIMEKVFHEHFGIQDIAPVVINTAAKGDLAALKIINEAVSGLLDNIITFLKVSGRKNPIRIAFIGSIIENKNIISDKLKKEIKKLKIIEVVKKKNSSSYGAMLLASEYSPIIKKL